MKIIKAKYSIKDLESLENKEKERSNGFNPIIFGFSVLNFFGFILGVYVSVFKFFFFMYDNYYFNSNVLGVLTPLIAIIIFCAIHSIISSFVKILQSRLVENNKIRVNRLTDVKILEHIEELKHIPSIFFKLKEIYSNIQFVMSMPVECLEDCTYYKVDCGLEIVGTDGSYFLKNNIDLGEYRDEICKDDCVDFSVLDKN